MFGLICFGFDFRKVVIHLLEIRSDGLNLFIRTLILFIYTVKSKIKKLLRLDFNPMVKYQRLEINDLRMYLEDAAYIYIMKVTTNTFYKNGLIRSNKTKPLQN